MTATSLFESFAGLLLLFVLPGYTTTRALFPEWRIQGSEAWRRAVEIVTLSFVLSIGWTVVVGYLLLTVAPGGFQAFWTDPELEVALLGVSVVAFVVGWHFGAYSRTPPARSSSEPDPGGEGAWELTRQLDQLARDERRLEHELRVAGRSGGDAAALESRLAVVREESSRLRQDRESQYAQ
jgi:hypothetical protein